MASWDYDYPRPDTPGDNDVAAAYKYMSPIFIAAIIVSNACLLYAFIRQKGRCLLSRRKCIIMTLSGGDLLLASLLTVAYLHTNFDTEQGDRREDELSDQREDELTFACRTRFTTDVYHFCYFPFVYGVALHALCAELIFRDATNVRYYKVCILAGIPWVVGLVLILPLSMAGFDIDSCTWKYGWTISRERAWYVISIVIPTFTSVAGAVVTKRGRMADISEYHDVESLLETDPPEQEPVLEPPPYRNCMTITDDEHAYGPDTLGAPPPYSYINHAASTDDTTESCGPESDETDRYTPLPPTIQQQNRLPLNPLSLLSEHQESCIGDPPTEPPPPYYSEEPVGELQPPTYDESSQSITSSRPVFQFQRMLRPTTMSLADIREGVEKEQNTLLMVSVAYALLTLPYAVVMLKDLLSDKSVSETGTHKHTNEISRVVVICLLNLRSVVTPLIWLRTEKLKCPFSK